MPKNKDSILKLSIFNSIIRMLQITLNLFLGIYFVNIGLSGTEIGFIFAISTITSIITIIPSGLGSDTLKSKNLILIAITLLAIQFITLSQTENLATIITVFIIGGIGASLYTTGIESLFYKKTQNKKIAKKIALFQGLSYATLGIGVISAGYLLSANISFKDIFTGIGFIYLTMIIIGFLIIPENKTTKLEIIHYKKDILQKKPLFFMLIIFLFSIHIGVEKTSYSLFLKETLNLSTKQLGFYMGIAIFFMAISSWLIASKFQKLNPKNILIYGLATSGIGHVLMTINNPIISFFFRVIHEIGDTCMLFFIFYGISKLFDLERIGGNAGIFKFISTIGSALGAILLGPLGEIYGYNIPIVISGGTTILAFLLSIKFSHLIDHSTTK